MCYGRGMIIYGKLSSVAMKSVQCQNNASYNCKYSMLVFVIALSVPSTCSSLLTTFKTFVLCEFELCIFNLVEDVLLVAKKVPSHQIWLIYEPN